MHQIIWSSKTHFQVNLSEFRLPVGAQIFISEAGSDLEIAVHTGDHQQLLKDLGGLDYYVKTVFEVTTEVLGAQNSIGGGGRFDGLTETIGGPHLPSAGFATGMERILQTMQKQNVSFPSSPHPFIFLIPIGEESLHLAFKFLCQLRHEKIPSEIDLSGKKIQHGLQLANQLKSEYSIVIGEEELNSKIVQLKNMAARESTDCPLDKLVAALKALFKEKVHV